MKQKIINNKDIILDLTINIFSFGIYILAQQIILMPIMGNWLDEKAFSKLVIYISIFSIISNSLGSELGIARQIKEDLNNGNIYKKILLLLFPIIIIVSIILLLFFDFSLQNTIFFTIIILMANIRLYSSAYFKLNKNFKKVFIQNLLYLIGIILGLITYKYIFNYIWIPLIFGEFFALIYSLLKTDILKVKIKNTKIEKSIIKSFTNLSFISLLVNGMTYFDKILIYPMLGTSAVNVYYSTNSMSKIISLITNPLHGVLLSWIKSDDKNEKKKIINNIMKINIPLMLSVFITSIPITYIAIKLLYPQYLIEAKILIIPVSIGLSFSVASAIVKAPLLKYTESKEMAKAYLLYFIIFIIITIPMSKLWGILGYTIANSISKIILWIEFLILLKKNTNKEEYRK